jgi:subtilase family serine protease
MTRRIFARAFVYIPMAALMLQSASLSAHQVKAGTPLAVQQAVDQGPVTLDDEVNLTVHLKLPNQAEFDKAVEELYNPQSPTYEHWMSDAELQTYAPKPAAMAAVKAELMKQGLTILSFDPQGFSVRAQGTIASVQKAFQTQIHQFAMKSTIFRGPAGTPHLTGGADVYVGSVAGLSNRQAHPLIRYAVSAKTGKAAPPVPLAKVNASSNGLGSIITDACFTGPKTFTFNSSTPLPVGVFYGNDYDDSTLVCAFTSKQLQAHYGLPAAYAKGYDGTGQTIALIEAYGYPTIEADANAYFKLAGLPALNSSNFEIIYPEGKPRNPNAGVLLGWDVEIALDVQWAHTIAPKAKILVVAAAGQDNEDFQDAITYVVKNKLAYTLSNSWESDSEQFAGPAEVDSFNSVLEYAAAKGVSVNFSSGDGGDDGNGSPMGSPEVPADSPYATAVGGTAILNGLNGGTVEVGWGNVQSLLDFDGPFNPPLQFGFTGGAGGGESVFNAKPRWQAALPGTGRQVPDVSALSDPYTGVSLVITQSGTQYVYPGIGGTSLGCPIFSAFWALADQAAGHPLGQAAPRIAKYTANQMNDILPVTSSGNVTGFIIDSTGEYFFAPSDLVSFGITPPNVDFISAVWPYFGAHYLEAFALDSSLSVAKGWDNVTGFGVPNGLTFIEKAGK